MHIQSFDAIILAGGVKASPLSRGLGTNVLTLPLTPTRTVLSLWIESLCRLGNCRTITVAVSSSEHADQIDAALADIEHESPQAPVQTRVDDLPWRGTAGVVRDLMANGDRGDSLVVAEAVSLPSTTSALLVDRLDDTVDMVVGVGGDSEPAGVYALRPSVLDLVPETGFFDIKEQLLPALHRRRRPAVPVRVTDRARTLWDRCGYLDALTSAAHVAGTEVASIGPSVVRRHAASVLGVCLVDRGVTLEPTAVIHDSVILAGAHIGAGAVVSRSVIGCGAHVPDRTVLRKTIFSSVSHRDPHHSATRMS